MCAESPAQQHPPVAVFGRLVGSIRPGCGELKGRYSDFGAGDTAQHALHVVKRDQLRSVESAPVELDHRDRAG
jgi:hypothetical protein